MRKTAKIALPAAANPLPDMGGLDAALGFRLRMLEQTIMRSFARHMEPLEISPTLYSILVLIGANPDCRQSDLSQALDMHPPNLVERVGLLVQRGLVVRKRDASDGRAQMLDLSDIGRTFMDKLRIAHDAHIADLRERFGAARYDGLMLLTEPGGGALPPLS